MAQQVPMEHMPESVLTFRPFIDYLRKRRDETQTIKSRFFSFVIEQFEQHPALLEPMRLDDVKQYAELLQLIYTTLSPIIENEDHDQWALCLPLKPTIFYGTNAYYRLISDIATGRIRNIKPGLRRNRTLVTLETPKGETIQTSLNYVFLVGSTKPIISLPIQVTAP